MKRGTNFPPFLLLSALAMSFATASVFADDDVKPFAPAKAESGKLDSPKAELTDRERWLLERFEQLEKRVAELENKSQPAATPTSAETRSAEATAAGPRVANPTAGAARAFLDANQSSEMAYPPRLSRRKQCRLPLRTSLG